MQRNFKSKHPGFRRSRACKWPGKAGHLAIYQCEEGAPVPVGPDGEKWAVVYHPGGKKKGGHVYVTNLDTARMALTKIGDGEYDDWGLFAVPKIDETSGKCGQSPEEIPRGGMALPEAGNLTARLMLDFPPEVISGHFARLLGATKPVYATDENGVQGVVDHEPDNPTQVKALALLLSYQRGTPNKRPEEMVKPTNSGADLMERMKKPGYRRALRALMDEMDAAEENRKLASMHATDVPAEEAGEEEGDGGGEGEEEGSSGDGEEIGAGD